MGSGASAIGQEGASEAGVVTREEAEAWLAAKSSSEVKYNVDWDAEWEALEKDDMGRVAKTVLLERKAQYDAGAADGAEPGGGVSGGTSSGDGGGGGGDEGSEGQCCRALTTVNTTSNSHPHHRHYHHHHARHHRHYTQGNVSGIVHASIATLRAALQEQGRPMVPGEGGI